MIYNRYCRPLLLALLLSLWAPGARAQLSHAQGGMGAGARFGLGSNGWDVGAMWSWQKWSRVGLLCEVDMERAEIDGTKFKNVFMLGLGAEYTAWQPLRWLYLTAGGTLDIGYDKREIEEVESWKEDAFVYGLGMGLGAEAWVRPWLSVVVKWREWLMFGFDDNYMKPDYSVGVRYNW